jgi:thiol:disulfide interchange protein DsbD
MKSPPIEIVPVPTEIQTQIKSRNDGESTATVSRNGGPSPGRGQIKPLPISENSEQYQSNLDQLLEDLRGAPSTTETTSHTFEGLLAFILQGIFWGGISLVTPCVFPMIPITVSFFLKQSEKEHYKPVAMAVVYSLTIVIVLTIAAVALLSFFRLLSVHPAMNIGLGLLFVYFSLSLFGWYEIELPSFLTRWTSAGQQRGGMVGTIFMALTFTIVSFACVAPFLGGFGGTTAGASVGLLHRVLGGFAFAVTFASPFFVLALFPNLLKKMPKSGNWLNNVKVVMGFLELAAALKFFRAGELILLPKAEFFTYDFVLAMWVGLAILCGLYLLGSYRLPHDTPASNISVPRLVFSFLFVGLGFYLLPALFHDDKGNNQRPNGATFAWIDSFLLPEPSASDEAGRWSGNLSAAVAEARASGKRQLIFVDFTGETCTNCKINEKNVFVRPEIETLFDNYRLVALYTDKVPNKFYSPEIQSQLGAGTARQQTDAKANLEFQKAAFGTEQLPLYVVLEVSPEGKLEVLDKYEEGKINDIAGFADFLAKPLTATP